MYQVFPGKTVVKYSINNDSTPANTFKLSEFFFNWKCDTVNSIL